MLEPSLILQPSKENPVWGHVSESVFVTPDQQMHWLSFICFVCGDDLRSCQQF